MLDSGNALSFCHHLGSNQEAVRPLATVVIQLHVNIWHLNRSDQVDDSWTGGEGACLRIRCEEAAVDERGGKAGPSLRVCTRLVSKTHPDEIHVHEECPRHCARGSLLRSRHARLAGKQ